MKLDLRKLTSIDVDDYMSRHPEPLADEQRKKINKSVYKIMTYNKKIRHKYMGVMVCEEIASSFIENYNNMIDELERRQDYIDLLKFEITKLKEQLPYKQ
jgi:hypothetical protein